MVGKKKTLKTKPKKKTKLTARQKYARGGRVEAYTFGEALGSKRWP